MAVDARDSEEELDKNLLAALPAGGKVVSVEPSGEREYCETFRIDVELPDGDVQSFFQKESPGQRGLDLMQSSFLLDSTIRSFIPEYVPKSLKIGAYESRPDTHFYLAEFVELFEGQPGPEEYTEALVALHKRSMGKSPEGKYGFEFNTRFGDLVQKNDWNDTWEGFWTAMMKEYFAREEDIRGPYEDEFLEIREVFFSRVIPRYLRPLESNGNSIQPCLIHADLWPGNVKFGMDPECKRIPFIYDSCTFWAHNEVDIAVLRNERYTLGSSYVDAYHRHIQPSEPEADKDKRAELYLIRNRVLLSTLYPGLRGTLVGAVRNLVEGLLTEDDEAAFSGNKSVVAAGGEAVASENNASVPNAIPVTQTEALSARV